MKFESVKCDECGRIQDISNHWLKLRAWFYDDGGCVGVAMGDMAPTGMMGVSNFTSATAELRDLCGQGCAMKHIAKLLGWSTPGAGE